MPAGQPAGVPPGQPPRYGLPTAYRLPAPPVTVGFGQEDRQTVCFAATHCSARVAWRCTARTFCYLARYLHMVPTTIPAKLPDVSRDFLPTPLAIWRCPNFCHRLLPAQGPPMVQIIVATIATCWRDALPQQPYPYLHHLPFYPTPLPHTTPPRHGQGPGSVGSCVCGGPPPSNYCLLTQATIPAYCGQHRTYPTPVHPGSPLYNPPCGWRFCRLPPTCTPTFITCHPAGHLPLPAPVPYSTMAPMVFLQTTCHPQPACACLPPPAGQDTVTASHPIAFKQHHHTHGDHPACPAAAAAHPRPHLLPGRLNHRRILLWTGSPAVGVPSAWVDSQTCYLIKFSSSLIPPPTQACKHLLRLISATLNSITHQTVQNSCWPVWD